MHNLEFNIGIGSIHQLPQTTGDGIHSLLQEVMWDIGDNFPNPVLQLFQRVRFCDSLLLVLYVLLRPFVQPEAIQ